MIKKKKRQKILIKLKPAYMHVRTGIIEKYTYEMMNHLINYNSLNVWKK